MTCCDGDILGAKLEGLLACASAALAECNVPVCRAFVSTAPVVPWDVCCQCNGGGVGQLWVSVDRIDPMLIPAAGGGEVRCSTQYEANVWLGLIRCALTQDSAGNPPSADALTQEAMDVVRDRLILTQALRCCFAANNDIDEFTVRSWESLAGGGCVGGRINVTLRFADPRCN